MKSIKLLTLFTFAALLFAAPANAVMVVEGDVVAVEEAATPTMTKKQERQLAKMEKQMAKMEKRLAKDGKTMNDVDFGDPVQKWMWFWIFGWVGAIVLFVIASVVAVGSLTTGGFGFAGILYLLGYLLGLFGSISLIIWLIKMFA